MVRINLYKVSFAKHTPLRHSWATRHETHNLFLSFEKGGVTGWGESVPSQSCPTPEALYQALTPILTADLNHLSIKDIYRNAKELNIPKVAFACLDMALWDHQAKQCQRPLYQHLKLALPRVPTSVTIGFDSPGNIYDRAKRLMAENDVRIIKLKLGCADGVDADRDMFDALKRACEHTDVAIRVDVNGGWTLDEALPMCRWLAKQGTELVEQPLAVGVKKDLIELTKASGLPVFADESCQTSADVAAIAPYVQGINVKLMKCGGISETLKTIQTAKAHGLKVMIGCTNESSVAIAAGTAISGAVDYVDLDSHLSLQIDPALNRVTSNAGIMMPLHSAGHGGSLRPDYPHTLLASYELTP